MSGALAVRRQIRLIALSAMLVSFACASLLAYQVAIHRFEIGGPVDQWLQIAFERRQLEETTFERRYFEELYPEAGLSEPERYESELQRLSQLEQLAVSNSDFPADITALYAHLQARETLPRMPLMFWWFFILSSITCASAVSWLCGFAEGVESAEPETNSTVETNNA